MQNYKLDEITELDILSDEPEAKVILFNDDFHSFEEVIRQIIKACNYPVQQAEQISVIVHTKGKATVITSSFERCLEVAAVLQEIDLMIDIEPVEASSR